VLDCADLDRRNVSSLRIVVTVGSAMSPATRQRFLDRIGERLLEIYGLTEGVGTCLEPEEMRSKPASVGRPVAGSEIRILDDAGQEVPPGQIGEIAGYSLAMMSGYHNQPRATEEATWRDERGRTFLRTGDMGRLDEEGYLYILDRKKDMIISGGLNVFASDIEGVLLQHPDVAEACVIAVPHEKWGESPRALIVRRPGATAREEQIREWANERVAKHQRLLAVEFRDEFPRNAVGKVLKKQLRDPFWKDVISTSGVAKTSSAT
jgi:acyl-CoA synthetase (AMP-forming)/AMP-acid ligase II